MVAADDCCPFTWEFENFIQNEARPLGVEVEDLETIRINFLLGSKGIELAYAFADYTATAIRDVMQLEVYDGMDPSKLQLNVVKAPNCRARL
ncbi:hypothetical protein COOONC_19151 [Cooperia oncophora]